MQIFFNKITWIKCIFLNFKLKCQYTTDIATFTFIWHDPFFAFLPASSGKKDEVASKEGQTFCFLPSSSLWRHTVGAPCYWSLQSSMPGVLQLSYLCFNLNSSYVLDLKFTLQEDSSELFHYQCLKLKSRTVPQDVANMSMMTCIPCVMFWEESNILSFRCKLFKLECFCLGCSTMKTRLHPLDRLACLCVLSYAVTCRRRYSQSFLISSMWYGSTLQSYWQIFITATTVPVHK